MLKEVLEKRKSSIVYNWVQSILETYPHETSKFLRLQKDRFSNPVGYTISINAEKIVGEIIADYNTEKIKSYLNEIIKIRAIQQFPPSRALGFIFSLKKVMQEGFKEEINLEKDFIELSEFESRIDEMILIAFDLYMEAREKVFQIRVNEMKSRSLYDNNKSMS